MGVSKYTARVSGLTAFLRASKSPVSTYSISYPFFSLICLTNIIGLRINAFNDKPLHWDSSNNPFLLIASISMFCLAKNFRIKSRVVNYISGLSMLIYIIHENIFIRSYTRPQIMEYICNHYDNSKIVLWVFLLAALIFIVSVIASIVYKLILEKVTRRFADFIYFHFVTLYEKFESKIVGS